MKKILYMLCALLCFTGMQSTSFASTLLFQSSVAANLPETLQTNVRAGDYGTDVTVLPGTWNRSLYNLTITAVADDGVTRIGIDEITNLVFTIKANTTASTFAFNVGTQNLKWNTEGLGAPVFNAYDQLGNNITAGITGQNVVGTVLPSNVYKIVVSDFRIQLTPAPTLGGVYTVNADGDRQWVEFSGSAVTDNGALSAGTISNTYVSVPEPNSTLLLMGLCLGALMRRRK